MKKVLLVAAAAAAAAFVSSKQKQHTASQELWKQVSDQPGQPTDSTPSAQHYI
ncbi:DLW-39 family protein [Demetria terragena]|uniref:DLW-39 family protein n=1 Tax=Demetria terragena TaxID=63959 RepID=UPI00036CEFBD|nr:DLW-39 family protein [Demetria terragena]